MEQTVEELKKTAPVILKFMPSKKIFSKLIQRATQISDVIAELNPLEAKTDKRKMKDGEEEELRLGHHQGQIVF